MPQILHRTSSPIIDVSVAIVGLASVEEEEELVVLVVESDSVPDRARLKLEDAPESVAESDDPELDSESLELTCGVAA